MAATPFTTQIVFSDVKDALSFINYLKAQKLINTARLKENAPAINAIIDTVCTEIVTNADADSLKAFTLAQFSPDTVSAPATPTITTPNSTQA